MKTYKIILSALVLVLAVSACKDDLAELNEDKKNPTQVSGEYLFSYAQNTLANSLANTNVNRNVFRLWAQYWTETQYPDESQYIISPRNVPGNVWQRLYRDVLQDLQRSQSLLATQPTIEAPEAINNKIAIAEIMTIYTYHRMVTLWGHIPYSQALNIDETTTPAYDDAASIYENLFARLDNAISILDESHPSFIHNEDYIYNGDVTSWKHFANSLKLKMATIVADVPELNPGQRATEAIAGGLLSGASENANYSFSSNVPYTNPLWEDLVASGRNDFVAANTIVDFMNTLDDPRRPFYFDQNITEEVVVGGDTTEVPVYIGGIYGKTNSWSNFSHLNGRFFNPTYIHSFMTYSEVLFYQAEMAARTLVGGDAGTLYDQAIAESMTEWSTYGGGAGIAQADIDAYIGQADVAYDATKWKERIGMQMWLGFYNRGYEGWTTWRRLDQPEMNAPGGLEDFTAPDDFPVRFYYPIVEQTTNGANWAAAVNALGGDEMTIKLFWDKN